MWKFTQENTGRKVKNEAGDKEAHKGYAIKPATPVDNWSLVVLKNAWRHWRICLNS